MFYIKLQFDYNDAPVDIYLQNGFFSAEVPSVNFHRHVYAECHYIICGKYEFNINGNLFIADENTAILIEPGIFHSFNKLHSNGKRIVFQINCPFLSKAASEAGFSIKKKEFELTERLEREICMFLQNRRCSILREYLRLFFFDVIIGENNINPDLQFDRKLQIYEIISSYYNTNLTLNDIADNLHLSPRQTSRILQTYFGMNFNDMLTETRLENAKFQIEHTSKPLTDIAFDVGFQSYNGFWKAFRKKYGISPNQSKQT